MLEQAEAQPAANRTLLATIVWLAGATATHLITSALILWFDLAPTSPLGDMSAVGVAWLGLAANLLSYGLVAVAIGMLGRTRRRRVAGIVLTLTAWACASAVQFAQAVGSPHFGLTRKLGIIACCVLLVAAWGCARLRGILWVVGLLPLVPLGYIWGFYEAVGLIGSKHLLANQAAPVLAIVPFIITKLLYVLMLLLIGLACWGVDSTQSKVQQALTLVRSRTLGAPGAPGASNAPRVRTYK